MSFDLWQKSYYDISNNVAIAKYVAPVEVDRIFVVKKEQL